MKDAANKIAERTFGVELELEGISREKAARTIQAVIGGEVHYAGTHYDTWALTAPDGRVWKAMYDGSLYGTHAEVVTPILKMADLETLQKILRALRAAGAKASQRCGAHVHVGAADLNARQLANLVKVFYRQEKLIVNACKVKRSRMNFAQFTADDFLARIEHKRGIVTMRELNEAWFGSYTPHPMHYDNHRYRTLNLNNLWNEKKTVEFRLFNGTTHAGQLKANIQLALCLVTFAKEARAASAKHQRTLNTNTSKYDVRVFLLRLGMIGEAFKTARQLLTKHLGGSTAWRGERRD